MKMIFQTNEEVYKNQTASTTGFNVMKDINNEAAIHSVQYALQWQGLSSKEEHYVG